MLQGVNTSYDLTLSSLAVGTSIATLSDSAFWHSLSGIREGCRISTDDGGLAVISAVPYQVNVITVTITSAFLSLTYTSTNWQLAYPVYKDLLDYVPINLKDKDILRTYLESMQDVITDSAADLIYRLENMRNWEVSDEELIKLSSETLGFLFDMSSRFKAFDAEAYRRLVRDLHYFYEINGTKYYLDFISGVNQTTLQRHLLYTTDYVTFSRTESTGSYLTNRIDLVYDINDYPLESDLKELTKLFYYIAPAVVVIQRFFSESSGIAYVSLEENQPFFDYAYEGYDEP